jgi:hypothetical protein
MSFGTPGQEALFQLDTGSTTIWVVNESAALLTDSHHGYDGSKSTTFADEAYTVSLSYGSGELRVAAARDTLTWNPVPKWTASAPNTQFGVTVNGGGWIDNGWEQFRSDGIFGLAMQGLCPWHDCSHVGWQGLWQAAGFAPAFALTLTPKQDPVPDPSTAGGIAAVAAADWLPLSAKASLIASLTRTPTPTPCTDAERAGVAQGVMLSIADAAGPVHVWQHAVLALAASAPARLGAAARGGALGPRPSIAEAARTLSPRAARTAGLSDSEIVAASLIPGRLSAGVARQSSLTLGGLNGSHVAAGASLYTIPLEQTGDKGGYGYYWAQLQQVTVQAPVAAEAPTLTRSASSSNDAGTGAESGTGDSGDDDNSGSGGGASNVWCQPQSGTPAPSCLALFDSGTSLLALREDVFDGLATAIDQATSGACTIDSGREVVLCPANTDLAKLPSLSFTFGVSAVTAVHAGTMVEPPAPSGGATATYDFSLSGAAMADCVGYGTVCRIMIMAVPSTVGDINFILGDTFLRSWATLFDAQHFSVSLARSTIGPEPTGTPLPLSPAVIAGIAIGSVVGAGLLAVLGCYAYARCQVARRSAALATLDGMEGASADAAASGEVVFVDGQYVVLTD